MRTFGGATLLFVYFSLAAAAQTGSSGASSRKVPPNTRPIPSIKCVDKKTAAACKSFKELVDARDDRLLVVLRGMPDSKNRHVSYVCLRPNTDAFSVIGFDIFSPKEYRPAPSSAEDALKNLLEKSAFMDFSDPPAVSAYTKDQWFQDHLKAFRYHPGMVFDSVYQDGIDSGSIFDPGEWSMPASGQDGPKDSPAWFVGAYAWIERFNNQHGDVSAKDDDPEHGHIRVDPEIVYVHYKFKNRSRDTVDYTLQIHRLTGRFVEQFIFPDDNHEESGTCMIFR